MFYPEYHESVKKDHYKQFKIFASVLSVMMIFFFIAVIIPYTRKIAFDQIKKAKDEFFYNGMIIAILVAYMQ